MTDLIERTLRRLGGQLPAAFRGRVTTDMPLQL
jgi:hypothetical protein